MVIVFLNLFQFLLSYLAERIDSYSIGSDVDADVENVEKKLTSALAICLLISKYKLNPTKEQWNSLTVGLSIPPNLQNQDYFKLVKNILETYKPIKR